MRAATLHRQTAETDIALTLNDALLVKVTPAGPACHTGEMSCFFHPLAGA